MKAGHGLNSTRLTAGAFANGFGSDALLRRSGHRHAGAGGGSLGRKRRVPALPFEGAPLLHLDPPYLEVPVVPQAVFTKAGTIFEVSPIGLDRWPIAIWMVANAEQRVGPYKLHRLLGVTQTTAQFMLRSIPVAVEARKSARDRSAEIHPAADRHCGGTQSRDLRTGSGAAAEAPAHYGRDEGREIAGGKENAD